MYTVKYQTEQGWQSLTATTSLALAQSDFDYLAQYYRYVSIIKTETVVNETTVRESNNAQAA